MNQFTVEQQVEYIFQSSIVNSESSWFYVNTSKFHELIRSLSLLYDWSHGYISSWRAIIKRKPSFRSDLSKYIITNLIVCYRFKVKIAEQIMRHLLKVTLCIAWPYLKTGLDCGDPFRIKTSNLRTAKNILQFSYGWQKSTYLPIELYRINFVNRTVHFNSYYLSRFLFWD